MKFRTFSHSNWTINLRFPFSGRGERFSIAGSEAFIQSFDDQRNLTTFRFEEKFLHDLILFGCGVQAY